MTFLMKKMSLGRFASALSPSLDRTVSAPDKLMSGAFGLEIIRIPPMKEARRKQLGPLPRPAGVRESRVRKSRSKKQAIE
jgi:hypothetical protein